MKSLIATGTPASGRGSPGPIASASARARSGQVSTNALSSGPALDRGQRVVDELARAQPALADQRGLLGGAARERVEAHGAASRSRAAAQGG